MTTLTAIPDATTATRRGWVVRHPLAAFYTLSLAGTWLVALPILISATGFGLLPYFMPVEPLRTLSAYAGPLLAAFVVTTAADGWPGVAALLRRVAAWRVGWPWYFIAIFGYVLFDIVIGALVSGSAALAGLAHGWPLIFTVYLPALFTYRLISPLAEEIGWAGFAQPRLRQTSKPLAGAVFLGALWAVWHLPGFFMGAEMGAFDPVGYVFFVLLTVLTRLIWIWVTNKAHGSVLIAVLLHASSNANSLNLRPQIYPAAPPEAGLVALGLTLLVAVAVLIGSRGRLAYASRHADD